MIDLVTGIACALAGFLVGGGVVGLVAWRLLRHREVAGREIAAELLRTTDEERRRQVEQVVETVKASFGSLSLSALGKASEQLTTLAKSQLTAEREASSQEVEGKKQLIDQQLKQMNSQLESVANLVRTLERDRENKFGELAQRLTITNDQTSQLIQITTGLRETLSSSQARGQWGERIADDILRVAGFIENINYLKQKTIETGGSRPDFTFLLPRNQSVNMDVKFPIANYLRMVEAKSTLEKERARKDFLSDVRARIKELTNRGYINDAQNTVDCVLLFIPHEQVFAFIQSEDAAVFDEALKQRVVCCSPMTLFAVLAVIRQAVDNFALEKTSFEILRHLGEFKKQWEKFTEKLEGLGTRIESLQKEYEAVVTTRRRQLEKPLEKLESLRLNSGQDNLLVQATEEPST